IAGTSFDADSEDRRLQVFVDNGTSVDEQSIHGANSKIFQQTVSSINPGEIVIESDVGTEESFIQIHTDVNTGITIASIKIDAIEENEKPEEPKEPEEPEKTEEPKEPEEPEVPREPGEDDIIVSQDGSGDFDAVQEAIDSIPSKNEEPVTIFVKNGVYKEVVTVPRDRKSTRLNSSHVSISYAV